MTHEALESYGPSLACSVRVEVLKLRRFPSGILELQRFSLEIFEFQRFSLRMLKFPRFSLKIVEFQCGLRMSKGM